MPSARNQSQSVHDIHGKRVPIRVQEGVSDSPGLMDFAIRLVNSVLNLLDEQVTFF